MKELRKALLKPQ